MRIRIKLVLAITCMVSAMVIALSILYLTQLLSERIQQSYQHNDIAAHQVLLAVLTHISLIRWFPAQSGHTSTT